jgi:tRNA(Arg) A34 adenosine deaminase TadA
MKQTTDSLHIGFLDEAVRMAAESAKSGGGPFGALVVRAGEIIGCGSNRVTADLDPTAHAEVVAIRDACRQLADYRLTGAVLYASCMPCPMCYAAICWARINRVYYAASAEQAAAAGFDDLEVARALAQAPHLRQVPCRHIASSIANRPFQIWQSLANRHPY